MDFIWAEEADVKTTPFTLEAMCMWEGCLMSAGVPNQRHQPARKPRSEFSDGSEGLHQHLGTRPTKSSRRPKAWIQKRLLWVDTIPSQATDMRTPGMSESEAGASAVQIRER